MIKKVLILGMSFTCLTACNNDMGTNLTETDNVEVRFNVNALNVDVQPMMTRTIPSSILTNIHYALQNTTTQKWYSGEQSLSDAGDEFGHINLWIPTGNYKVTFFGYGNDNPSGEAGLRVEKDYNKTYININNKDGFMYNSEVSIGDSETTTDVNLTRLSSKLVIKLNDVIPSDIGKIKARLTYYPLYDVARGEATYAGSSGLPNVMEEFLIIKNSNVEEYGFFLLPQRGRVLTITLYDTSNNELGSCNVTVSFYQNKRTIVEGNVLDVINQKPFVVTVTDTWDEDVIVPLQ